MVKHCEGNECHRVIQLKVVSMTNFRLYIFYHDNISKNKTISKYYLAKNQWPNIHSRESSKQQRQHLQSQAARPPDLGVHGLRQFWGCLLCTKRCKTSPALADQGCEPMDFTVTHPGSLANALDSYLFNSCSPAVTITCSLEPSCLAVLIAITAVNDERFVCSSIDTWAILLSSATSTKWISTLDHVFSVGARTKKISSGGQKYLRYYKGLWSSTGTQSIRGIQYVFGIKISWGEGD